MIPLSSSIPFWRESINNGHMNRKKAGILVIAALFVFAYIAIPRPPEESLRQDSSLSFPTKEECEQVTGMSCASAFVICDNIPEGRTFEEVCEGGFEKGWQPLPPDRAM